MATIKGVWVLKSIVTTPSFNAEYCSFISNGVSYTNLGYSSYDSEYDRAVLKYGSTVVYYFDSGFDQWLNEAYRTVDFGETEQSVSDTFYSWFTANAAQQVTATVLAKIKYGEEELGDLVAGKKAVVKVKGTEMDEDLVIESVFSPPVLVEGEATPTEADQEFTPTDADGYSKFTVKKIPSGYVKPSGTLTVTANGTFDVTEKASVTVAIPVYDGTVVIS